MVDSIKVYVKTKEAFGWPEDNEDFLDTAANAKPALPAANNMAPGLTVPPTDSDNTLLTPMPLTSLDRYTLYYSIRNSYSPGLTHYFFNYHIYVHMNLEIIHNNFKKQ